MSNWTDMILGDVANIEIGGTPSRDISAYWADTSDSGFPWVSIADLQKRVITETKERITEKGISHSNVKPIKEGTLIISFKLSIGRAALAGIDLFTNEAIAAITPKDKRIHADLLYYVLPGVAKNAITDTAVKGATLNKSSLGKLTFRVPIKYKQQEKIAKILQTIDRTITHTEALIEKYQQIKAGLMHDLFTRGIGADGKLRPPRDKAPELYQDSSIGWIPKEWEVKPLGELCDIASGGTPSRRNSSFWNGSIPWIKTGEIKYNEIVKTEEYITQKGLDSSSAKIFNKGTVVMAIYGEGNTRGRVAVLGIECASNQACVGFTLYDLVQSYFIYFFFENSYKTLRDISNDGSQKNLSSSLLKQVNISFPVNKNEQSQIEIRLLAIDNIFKKEKEFRDKLTKQKSGLMHDLLTGTVQVNIDPV